MDFRTELVDGAYRLDLAESDQLRLLVDVMRRRFEPRRRVQAVTSKLVDGKSTCRAAAVDDDDLVSLIEVSLSPPNLDAIFLSAPAWRISSAFVGTDYRARVVDRGIAELAGLNCPTHTGPALSSAPSTTSRCR